MAKKHGEKDSKQSETRGRKGKAFVIRRKKCLKKEREWLRK